MNSNPKFNAMKYLLGLCLAVVSFLSLGQQKQLSIHFNTDRFDLTTKAKQALTEFAQSNSETQIGKITITGHTDSRASDAYNELLSLQRAKAVADYLHEKLGYHLEVNLKHAGERLPVASNQSVAGMAKNRRVDIAWTVVEGHLSNRLLRDTDEDAGFESRRLPATIELKNSTALINGDKGAQIITKEGVMVTLPPSKDGDYSVTIKEVTDQEGMLKKQMFTMTDEGKYLESSYMACITASKNIDSMLVEVPKHIIDNEMSFYEGAGSGKEMSWKLTTVEKDDSYVEECDCYALWLPVGCYNFDKPLPESTQLLVAHYEKRVLVKKVLWIFPVRKELEPAFYFVFDEVNSVILPDEQTKNLVKFSNVPQGTTGKLFGVASYNGKRFVLEEELVAVDRLPRTKKNERKKFYRDGRTSWKSLLARL